MQSIEADELTRLEQRLKEEAHLFRSRLRSVECAAQELERLVCGLLRVSTCDLLSGETLGRLKRMRAAQRRWARSGHTAYDPNRHILLDRAFRAVCNAQQDRALRA